MTSNICHVSELNLFSANDLQTSILDSKENIYSPLTSLDNCQIIQFHIPASGEHYIDLNSICLRLKLQLLKSDGKSFNSKATTKPDEKESQPGMVNNALYSIFKSLRISFNNTVVSEINNYHYMTYINTLLNSSSDQKDSLLLPRGFVKDRPSYLDKLGSDNTGLVSRKNWSDDSLVFELYGRVYSDILSSPKLLVNNVSVDILFTLESPSFFLMGAEGTDASLKISEAALYARHITINPQLQMFNLKTLHSGKNIVYPYKKGIIKTFTISQGLSTVEINNLISGVMPTNFVMSMVENDAFSGSFTKNPYNFQHFGSRAVTFSINGVPVSPTPLEHNFSYISGFSRTYSEYLKSIGIFNSDKSSLVEREDMRKGFLLFPINLSPRQIMDENMCEDVPKEGNLSLSMKFASALTSTITVIIFAEFNHMIEIDKHYNVVSV